MINSIGKAIDGYKRLWSELKGVKLFLFYTLHYSIVFFILHHFLFGAFHEAGKSYMWTEDGGAQHLPKMLHVADMVQGAIESLLSGNGLWLPAYDFRLGTREMEIRVETLQILSAFWPQDKMDVLYDLLVVARFYLTGLSFSILGFYFKQKPLPVMIGSVSYMFCGFAIYAGVRHPSYLSPMIFFVFLIIGVDMVIKGKKGYLLTGTVFLVLTSGVYFAYMMALACILYTIVRFFDIYKEDRWKNFFKTVGRLALYVMPGVLMSCVLMIPTITQMLSTGRMGRDTSSNGSMLWYAESYRRKFFGTFTVYPMSSNWTCLGFSVLALPSIILLYKKKSKELRSLKIFFVILTLMLLIPGAAYVMSAFNSYVNRWCFIYSLCVAVIIMFMAPKVPKCSRKDMSIIVIICAAYYMLTLLWYGTSNENIIFIPFLIGVLAIVMASLGAIWFALVKCKKATLALMLAITCASTYVTAFVMYSPMAINYVKDFTDKGGAFDLYDSSQYGAFGNSRVNATDNSFYHVGASDIEPVAVNTSFLYDFNSITHFSTAAHDYYTRWERELESASRCANNKNYGVDARAAMLALSNVKYYVTNKGSGDVVPYGYELVETVSSGEKERNIYENKYMLPVGFTYSSYVTREDYDNLTALEKQEVQLQSVLLEEAAENDDIAKGKPELSATKIPFEITETDGAVLENGKLYVNKDDATVTLTFEGLPDSELYLYVKNFDVTPNTNVSIFKVTAKTVDSSTSAHFYSDASIYSNGMKSQMLNLGYSEEGYSVCNVVLQTEGTYDLEGFEIWCQPMGKYAEHINERTEDVLENIELTNEGIKGTLDLDENKILCMSVPYDKNWTAYIDGEKTAIKRANTGFFAIEIPKGSHVVEFEYSLPGLKIGFVFTIIGFIMLLGLIFFDVRKKRKNILKNS